MDELSTCQSTFNTSHRVDSSHSHATVTITCRLVHLIQTRNAMRPAAVIDGARNGRIQSAVPACTQAAHTLYRRELARLDETSHTCQRSDAPTLQRFTIVARNRQWSCVLLRDGGDLHGAQLQDRQVPGLVISICLCTAYGQALPARGSTGGMRRGVVCMYF